MTTYPQTVTLLAKALWAVPRYVLYATGGTVDGWIGQPQHLVARWQAERGTTMKVARQGRHLGLTAAMIAGSVLLAACGAGSQTPASVAKVVPCDFPPPDQPVKINVLAYNSSAIDPFTNSMVKSCTKDNVEIRHDPIDFGGQYTKTPITLAAPTGTYDIIEAYSSTISTFAAKGQLRPVDDLFEKYKDKYDLGGLDPQMLEGFSYDGKLYGLPMQANVGLMTYRKDIFDELGLEAPATYEDLVAAGQAIQEAGKMDYPIAMPASDPNTWYEQVMSSQGMTYVDLETNEPTFDTPEAERGLQSLVDLTPYMDPQVSTFDQPKVQQQLYNGKAAIAIMFSGRMGDLLQPENSQYSENFAFAAPPSIEPGGNTGSSLSVDGWVIPANSKVDPDLLFQVIASSVTQEAAEGSLPFAYPARTSVVTEENMPFAPAIESAIENGAALPDPYPWFTAMQDIAYGPLLKAWSGNQAVSEALADAQAAGQTVPTN